MSDLHDMPLFYPEIAAGGSLGKVLRRELAELNSSLDVKGFDELFEGSAYWARAEQGHRSSQISTAIKERSFGCDLWEKGVCLAQFATDRLDLLAMVLHAWCIECVNSRCLRELSRDVRVSDCASPFEAGPTHYVTSAWQSLVLRARDELRPIVIEAAKNTQLKRLFPFTSLDTLNFSRCTGYPFTRDCPTIIPLSDGTYRVADSTGRSLGEGDVRQTLEIAVCNLPSDCGAAVHGKAENLDASSCSTVVSPAWLTSMSSPFLRPFTTSVISTECRFWLTPSKKPDATTKTSWTTVEDLARMFEAAGSWT